MTDREKLRAESWPTTQAFLNAAKKAPTPTGREELREKVMQAVLLGGDAWAITDAILALLPRGEGEAPGLTVEIVDGPPPLPGVPSYAIRKWDNHGLKAGTYRLFTRPTPATPEGLREAVERIECAVADLQGEHEAMVGAFDPDRWSVEVRVSDLKLILSALQPQAQPAALSPETDR